MGRRNRTFLPPLGQDSDARALHAKVRGGDASSELSAGEHGPDCRQQANVARAAEHVTVRIDVESEHDGRGQR